MTPKAVTKQQLQLQVEELQWRLQEAEETLRVIFETMHEGALTLSDEGTILYCNTHFAEMVRTPLEQVIGNSLRQFVSPADLTKLEALMAVASGKAEVTLTAFDGTRLSSQLSMHPLQGDGLRATCVVVTDRSTVVAAAALKASEARFRALA